MPQEAPLTREEVRAIVRDAVLDATVPILQRMRALEEEVRGGGQVSRSLGAAAPRNSAMGGVIISAKPSAPGPASSAFVPSTASDLADDRELAMSFNGNRRRKQMAWILGLLALFAVAAAVIGAVASNMR